MPYSNPQNSSEPVQPASIMQAKTFGFNQPPGGANSQQFLESVLPGIGNLTKSATGAIGNLLDGLPSVSQARTTNAYWGVGAGQPAGGPGGTGDINSFIGQRGTDLYGQQAQQNQQQGLQDLMQTIGTYTSPALANQGQQMQNQQFGQNLAQQGSEFSQGQNQQNQQFQQNLGFEQNQANTQNQLNQFQAMLSALGLGNQITGQLPGNLQSF
jgi:hypothetical protein